ncbi:MAG: HAMP domain-containing histidine kinase [Niabella sp.]|nr:HAMP domain-containing histidine kinase [Niabella sp.]
MTLKRRIALSWSIAYSLLFGVLMVIIYYAFYDFRRDEFRQNLKDKSMVTAHFIAKTPDFIKGVPQFLSESDDGLYKEEILIFNQDKKLLYSTVKDESVSWDANLLKELDLKNEIYVENTTPEYFGVLIRIDDQQFYILTSAEDVNGRSKLRFLGYILLLTYVISTAVVWLSSYFFVRKLLRPLDQLTQQITDITAHNITEPVPEKGTNDEISVLARSFNTVMRRINDVLQSQKDFTSSAAHEIRTPLTRIAFQLENLKYQEAQPEQKGNTIANIIKDVQQLSDLTRSLLLLSKFDKENISSIYETERIDEVVFNAYEQVLTQYPELKMEFTIVTTSTKEPVLLINGIRSLLEIVFINLLKNAAAYSVTSQVTVTIRETDEWMEVDVCSYGPLLREEEQHRLFEPFMRGRNAQHLSGSGLGLPIVKRIIDYHKGQIRYLPVAPDQNIFQVRLPLQ